MIGQMLNAGATSAAPSPPGDNKPTRDTSGPAFGRVLQGHLDDRVADPQTRDDDEPVERAVVKDLDLDPGTGVVHCQVAASADQALPSAVVIAARVADTPSTTSISERGGALEHREPADAVPTAAGDATSVDLPTADATATTDTTTDTTATPGHLSLVHALPPGDTASSSSAIGLPAPAVPGSIASSSDAEPAAPTADLAVLDGPNVLDRAALHRLGGVSRLGMNVVTDELGAIRIDVADRRGILEVNIRADEFPTRVLLSGRLHELRQELSDSGIDVGSFGVGQGGTDQRSQPDSRRTSPNGDIDPALLPEDGIALVTSRAEIDELTGSGRVDVRL